MRRIAKLALAILLCAAPASAQSQHIAPSLDTNNNFTGQNTFPFINNVLYLGNVYACSDVGMNAAITALSTGGGTVDGSACTSGGTIAATVIVGANTAVNSHGVKLILPCTASAWGVTVTGGGHVFQIADESELAGCANRASIITVQSTANISDVISFLGNPADGGYTNDAKVSNISIGNANAGATVTNGLLNMTGLYDGVIRDVKLAGYAPCLTYVTDSTNPIGANADDVYNLLMDGQYDTGTQLLCVKPTHGAYIGPIHFVGGDWGHPGAGKSAVYVCADACTSGSTHHSYGLSFSNLFVESGNDNTAIFSISDTLSPSFDSVYISRVSGTSTAACLYFNDTGSGATDNISIKNLSCIGGMTPNAVLSNIAGIPNLAVNLVPGLFAPGIGGLSLTSSPAVSQLNVTQCGTMAACSATTEYSKGQIVTGTVAFSSSTTVSITGMPAFAAATSYSCSVADPTHAYTWLITAQTTTGFTITAGTSNSDTWNYSCSGY
jgi:hypothetical protein